MVYPGHPSRACETCRRRRVKCDENRPTCTRCQKSKLACGGYRQQKRIVFRNENHRLGLSNNKNIERLVGENSGGTSVLEPGIESQLQRTRAHASSHLTRQVSIANSEQHAICLFLDQFTDQKKGNVLGWLEFVPQMYLASAVDTHINCAIRAVAFASVSSQHKTDFHLRQAYVNFGASLTHLKTTLFDEEEAIKDEVVATLVLLSVFAHITGESLGTYGGDHCEGMEHILWMRGRSQFQTPLGRTLFRHGLSYVYLRNIATKKSSHLFRLMSQHWHDQSAFFKTTYLGGIVNEKCEALRTELSKPDDQNLYYRLRLLYGEAAALMEEFQFWSKLPPQPAQAQPNKVENTSAVGSQEPRFVGNETRDAWTLCLSNTRRCISSSLDSMMLRCVDRMIHLQNLYSLAEDFSLSPLREVRSSHIAAIQKDLAQICASVPLFLGDLSPDQALTGSQKPRPVAGYYLMFPLGRILASEHSTVEQKNLAYQSLEAISGGLGVKHANIIAGKAQTGTLVPT